MGIFWLELYKTIVIFEVKTIVILKFCEVTKMSKFGIKNALFCYFWAKILNKLYSYLKSARSKLWKSKNVSICAQKCLIWVFFVWNLKTILSYLKSAPIVLIGKFREKIKIPNLGTKMTYLGSFGIEFRKTIIIFEISTLEFVKNESLTHTVNFAIGSAFLKVWVCARIRFIKYAFPHHITF